MAVVVKHVGEVSLPMAIVQFQLILIFCSIPSKDPTLLLKHLHTFLAVILKKVTIVPKC